jgi:hypothetical protein
VTDARERDTLNQVVVSLSSTLMRCGVALRWYLTAQITLSKATGLNSKCFAAGRPRLYIDRPGSNLGSAHQRCYVYRSVPEYLTQVLGGLYHGASETSLEAKASQDSLAGRWSRRGVICDGRRRRSDCADSKCAVARH